MQYQPFSVVWAEQCGNLNRPLPYCESFENWQERRIVPLAHLVRIINCRRSWKMVRIFGWLVVSSMQGWDCMYCWSFLLVKDSWWHNQHICAKHLRREHCCDLWEANWNLTHDYKERSDRRVRHAPYTSLWMATFAEIFRRQTGNRNIAVVAIAHQRTRESMKESNNLHECFPKPSVILINLCNANHSTAFTLCLFFP